jgi:hypothetical protein
MDGFFPIVHVNVDLVPATILGAGGIVDGGSLNAQSARSGRGCPGANPAAPPRFDYPDRIGFLSTAETLQPKYVPTFYDQ